MKAEKNNIIEDKVDKLIIKLTIPMIFGTLSLVVFNLTDTYFIGKLGTNELAAISFTFPVVLLINSISLGMGIGAASIISRAVGKNDKEKIVEIATDALILSSLFVIITSIVGINTIEGLFGLLGAKGEMLVYIRQYMSVWYIGTPFVVIPMVGNSIIRALGDTKTPSLVMALAALVNVVLDPLLIFGIGIFPTFGIRGAAIATVISRITTFLVSLYILIRREKIIKFRIKKIGIVLNSWKEILYVGVPAMIVRMITPISAGIITWLISQYGYEAVAGYGVATRVEFFTLAFINSMSSIMVPFAGQNYGANRKDRIIEGMNFTRKTVFIYGIFVFIVLVFFSDNIAAFFNSNSEVQKVTIMYLTIIPVGYGFQGMFLINASILNAVNKPLQAALLSCVQMFIIYVPTALVLSKHFKIYGIFFALILSYLIIGIISFTYTKSIILNKEKTNI